MALQSPVLIPERGTQLEIDALIDMPAGASIYNTDTNKMNITQLGGATPIWEEQVPSSVETIDIGEVPLPTNINYIKNSNNNNAIQTFSNTPSDHPAHIFARSRGTSETPLPVVNNDTIGEIAFAGAGSDNALNYGAIITAKVDGIPTATTCPMRVEYLVAEGGQAAGYVTRSNGVCSWFAIGGNTQNATIDFNDSIDLKTDSFLVNSVDPFDPIFATIGHTSSIQVGSPTFTTPIAIAYSGKTEGTWTKIVGMSSINTSGDISFASDAITINQTGDYQVSVSMCLEVDVNAERVSLLSVGVNEDDTDKIIGALTPNASASEGDSSRWSNISVMQTLSLTAADTLKFFYCQTDEGGSSTNDVNIGIIRIDVRKLGRSGV